MNGLIPDTSSPNALDRKPCPACREEHFSWEPVAIVEFFQTETPQSLMLNDRVAAVCVKIVIE